MLLSQLLHLILYHKLPSLNCFIDLEAELGSCSGPRALG